MYKKWNKKDNKIYKNVIDIRIKKMYYCTC